MAFAGLALVLVYTCVLLIKSCDMSSVSTAFQFQARAVASAVCSTYGFGDTSEGGTQTVLNRSPLALESYNLDTDFTSQRPARTGIYLFFLFFGLSTLILQLLIGATRFVTEGYAPRIILVARAHSISPQVIIQRVIARRHGHPRML
jgi:hypothetical protein